MSDWHRKTPCAAFLGERLLATGPLEMVVAEIYAAAEKEVLLILDNVTSRTIEVDFRGSLIETLERLPEVPSPAPEVVAPKAPGRPKLGVVAREVTLLPRHWEWLGQQPGGASVALRKLVEEARRAHEGQDLQRQAQEAVYRFMTTMAGDRPGFEEAVRALYAQDQARFAALVGAWPADIAAHAQALAQQAFASA